MKPRVSASALERLLCFIGTLTSKSIRNVRFCVCVCACLHILNSNGPGVFNRLRMHAAVLLTRFFLPKSKFLVYDYHNSYVGSPCHDVPAECYKGHLPRDLDHRHGSSVSSATNTF